MPRGLASNPVFVRSDWLEGNLAEYSFGGKFSSDVLNKLLPMGDQAPRPQMPLGYGSMQVLVHQMWKGLADQFCLHMYPASKQQT